MSLVLNEGIGPGFPLSDKIKSQVSKIVINCRNRTFAGEEIIMYDQLFGKGSRLSEDNKVQADKLFWQAIPTGFPVERAYQIACRTAPVAAAPAPAAPAPAIPNAPVAPSEPATPGHLTRLSNTSYLFKDSIKKVGEDFRTMYIVDNAGIGPGKPLSDQVRSQVYQTVINCKNNTWAYDQLYWHDQLFGKGARLSEQKWQPDQLGWNPIKAGHPVERAYPIACR